jgi:hypothetical protein
MRSVWQISSGSVARSYAEVFLRYGVGLIGPGDAGPWRAERADDEFGGSHVRRFANEVEQDDVFLLRFGTSRIQAVGIVASDYLYLNQFDEVNGWDLQHARRLRWFGLPKEYDFGRPVFGANPWRFSRILHDEILKYAERFLNSPPTDWQTASLPPLPEEEEPLDDVPVYLQEIVAVAQDLGWNLYLNQQVFGDRPSEDEIIVHLVVPFLRALGWHPEQIAVKWRYIDLAIFRNLPRTPENCHLVIEAKHLGSGVEGALEQAVGYVESLGTRRDVLVTDGVRYRLYAADKGYASVAYANLGRLKKSAFELFSRLQRP